MNVFEYRAKRFNSSEWVYGQLIYQESRKEAFVLRDIGLSPIAIEAAKAIKVDSDTVCVKVGYAKNGDPVYEGDVVESCSWNEFFCKDGVTLEPFIRKFVVMFKDCRAVLKEIFDDGNLIAETSALFNLDDVSDLVVKGNLIDDPKLSPITFNEYCEKIKFEKPEVNYVKTNSVQSSVHPL